jgi:nitrate reductase molybdenum cofactor assembly chaperone NarJ/NarW
MASVTRTFKALSALLMYPTDELVAAMPDIEAAMVMEDLLKDNARQALLPLIRELQTLDLYDLQERYVDLFDKTRRHSLHLFEHIHGESRDRGQAMVDLVSHYERGGLDVTANELPDYLPLFLEFLSTRPIDEARSLLSETANILAVLAERLANRDSAYAAVFTAILSIIGEVTVVSDISADADEPNDLAALDAAWEETAVSFGPGDAVDGCSVDRLRIQIRAGRRDVRQANT